MFSRERTGSKALMSPASSPYASPSSTTSDKEPKEAPWGQNRLSMLLTSRSLPAAVAVARRAKELLGNDSISDPQLAWTRLAPLQKSLTSVANVDPECPEKDCKVAAQVLLARADAAYAAACRGAAAGALWGEIKKAVDAADAERQLAIEIKFQGNHLKECKRRMQQELDRLRDRKEADEFELIQSSRNWAQKPDTADPKEAFSELTRGVNEARTLLLETRQNAAAVLQKPLFVDVATTDRDLSLAAVKGRLDQANMQPTDDAQESLRRRLIASFISGLEELLAVNAQIAADRTSVGTIRSLLCDRNFKFARELVDACSEPAMLEKLVTAIIEVLQYQWTDSKIKDMGRQKLKEENMTMSRPWRVALYTKMSAVAKREHVSLNGHFALLAWVWEARFHLCGQFDVTPVFMLRAMDLHANDTFQWREGKRLEKAAVRVQMQSKIDALRPKRQAEISRCRELIDAGDTRSLKKFDKDVLLQVLRQIETEHKAAVEAVSERHEALRREIFVEFGQRKAVDLVSGEHLSDQAHPLLRIKE